MILAAFAVAAALNGMSPGIAIERMPGPRMPPPDMNDGVARTPNLYRPPSNCGDIHRQVVERQKEELKKLGRLPNGVAQYAVARTVGGCGVAAPIGYHPGYLLPGAADQPAVSAPPKP
jgi:hypothetical protein